MLLPATLARSSPSSSSSSATTFAYQGASNGAECGLSESPKPGRSIAITLMAARRERADRRQEGGLGPAEAVQADQRRSLAGREQSRSRGRRSRTRSKRRRPARVGAARRRQQADTQVEVAANAEPAGAEGVHAAAHVVGDLRPGRGVGAQPGVGRARPSGRLEPQLAIVDHGVEVARRRSPRGGSVPCRRGRPCPRAGISRPGPESRSLKAAGAPCVAALMEENATQPSGRYAQTFASVSDLTERRWGPGAGC